VGLVREASSQSQGRGTKLLYVGDEERGMENGEVLSVSLSFMCPDKESAHPIPLGKLRLLWATLPPSRDGDGGAAGPPLLSCTEVDCPHVVVVRPDLAVDLQAPLSARVSTHTPHSQ
jgi:hypothetical protein